MHIYKNNFKLLLTENQRSDCFISDWDRRANKAIKLAEDPK